MKKIHQIISIIGFLIIGSTSVFSQSYYRVKNFPASSRTANEVAPVVFGDGIVYSSDRETGGIQKRSGKNGQGISNIYFVKMSEDGNWGSPKDFALELKTEHNDGPISFNFNGDMAVFTRNFELPGFGSKKGGNPNFGLFIAEFDGTSWGNIVEYEFNDRNYHTTHPSLSAMGDIMYFASDRPGGFGGYDIYVSYQQNGFWSKPVNLGPVVNTAENEIFPFLHSSGRLYFSTNGHDRVGGYDIFYTDFFNNKWFKPVKLSPPFNSGLNDFTFYTDENYEKGMFTSNRRGSLDIFTYESVLPQFDFSKKQVENNFCYIFFEENTVSLDTTLYTYEWKMGDGVKVQAIEAEHCYKEPGDYLIELNVVDKLTGIVEFNQAEYLVEVRKVIQPYITSPDSAFIEQEIQLHGIESFLGDKKPGEYFWDFGDGQKAVGATVRHIYLSPGQYIVKLGIMVDGDRNEEPEQFCSYKIINITDLK
ncbi:MAG: PKD domain-containing protein [Bacteroidales bacterium]|nr:PKD domain-containing protein [Bacteroidales bacterium]MCF8389958.1 PKD domain-containing protein [Bacteroidales bacterium]